MQPYFAQEPMYSPRIAARVMEKVDRWYDVLGNLRTYQRARRFRQLYYGLPSSASPFDVTHIAEMGSSGELSALHANQFGVLAQRIHSMVVQDDLGWQPVATNTDSLSREDAAVARSVLDYERRRNQLERLFAQAAETAFLDTSAWMAVRWDPRGGAVYETVKDQRTGAESKVYTGRLWVSLHAWWRTVVDLYRHDTNHDWIILCDYHNKYDLVARFASSGTKDSEALAQRLLGLRREHPRVIDSQMERGTLLRDDDTPLVPVWKLYHRPTDAVPKGREVWVPDAQTVLYDGDAVYGEELPAARMSPSDWLDTVHGHTPLANLAAPQDALNMLLSSLVTNEANGAVANIWVPPLGNLRRSELGGANIWESEGKPEALNLVGSARSTFESAEVMKNLMIELAQLNPVSLGQQQQQMSGALAALLDSKSREGVSPFIRSYRWCVETVGTRIVECYKRFAKVPRSLEVIVGSDRRYMLKDFTGERLGNIARVTVEASSNLLSTTAGKLSFVENLLQQPAFQNNPRALRILFDIYNTGRIDPLLLEPETEEILIASENESMGRGEMPVVRWEDDDEAHVQGHRKLANNPTIRLDDRLMSILDEHLAIHRQQALMKASGVLGPGAAPPTAPPLPGPGVPVEAGESSASEAPEQPVEGAATDAGPEGPGLPSMPINPATGARAPLPPV